MTTRKRFWNPSFKRNICASNLEK